MSTIFREQVLSRAGRIAVLMGGTSMEREISLQSGQAVAAGLQRLGLEVTTIDVGEDLIGQLQAANPDLVFNLLHGTVGEDGVIQGLLEILGVPYTGSGVLASALAMDKHKCKLLWKQVGLNTADHQILQDDSPWQHLISDYGKLVVKPVNGGSSLGIAIVDNAGALQAEYLQAKQYDQQVMAEQWLSGPEYSIGVLGDRLLPTVLLQTEREFYDYEAKYVDQTTRMICPVDLPSEQLTVLKSLARQAYDSLELSGLARVDLMQGADGEFYLLEANSIPGMTSHSIVPASAASAGIGFDELLLQILECEFQNKMGHLH